MSVVNLIVKRRKEILVTCHRFGATNVRGFGDDCNHASDITLLVVFLTATSLVLFLSFLID